MVSSLSASAARPWKVATVAKLTRLFGYQNGEDRMVYPDESEWDLLEWQSSGSKGPWIQPLNDLVVIQQEPYPDRTESGLILFANDDKVDNVLHTATVLAVGKGKWEEEGAVRQPMDLVPGDRVATVRFIAYNRIPDDCNQRLRIVPEGEIWGYAGEEN